MVSVPARLPVFFTETLTLVESLRPILVLASLGALMVKACVTQTVAEGVERAYVIEQVAASGGRFVVVERGQVAD